MNDGAESSPGEQAFIEAAPKKFSFLTDLGFKLSIKANKDGLNSYRHLEWVLDPVTMIFMREWQGGDFYIAFEVGKERFSLEEVIDLQEPFAGSQVSWAAYGPENVQEGLDLYARLLTTYGTDALMGAPEFYDQLRAARPARLRRFELQMNAANIRKRAEAAFESGDYAAAASLYEEITEVLTELERRKLELAKRHSNQP